MTRETVAAVVVTYNRKQLLTECLDALLAQTRPVDKIILIDNASTDGTPELLEERGYLENPLMDYVRLPENTGGAGGFYEGIKRGHKAGYDWLWLMDDDGFPHEDCLSVLLSSPCMDGCGFRSPMVVDCEDHEKFSFPYDVGGVKYLSVDKLTASLSNECFSASQPFNGVLLGQRIIDKIGYPKKEMFIWGDEIEYLKRAISYGIAPVTSVNAYFYHPRDRQAWTPVFGGFFGHDLAVNGVRQYCFYRNQSYINVKYHGIGSFYGFFLKSLIKKLFTLRLLEVTIVVRAAIDGRDGVWGREKRYMK
ncbi:glycosyltransferase family 2 protein [Acidithiobacillus sp. M4-SHS-6]|uniref:glycosyltransferase family 2 protein n=1 Tax=Acidithiobacillus sp. M4-SHS-6 TaxID=3383024 RepID=UPI0039BDDBB2